MRAVNKNVAGAPLPGVTRLALAAGLLIMGSVLPASAQEAAPATAYVGATIHPMDGEAIAVGTVLVRGGKIERVSSGVDVPAGYEKVDLEGHHLMPGMVLAATDLGLVEIDSISETNDSTEISDNNADLRSEYSVHADSYRLPPTLRAGVTTGHVVLDGSGFSGLSAVLRFAGWNWQDMALRRAAFQHLRFPSIGADGDEESGALKELNELVDQALEHRRASGEGFAAGPAPKLEAIAAAVSGETRLLISAPSKRQIAAALEWTKQREIGDWVLHTTADASYLAKELAARAVPVILGGVLTLPARSEEFYDQTYRAPAVLHEAGVSFALSGAANSAFARNLMHEAAMAVAYGLPEAAALRAVTAVPAEILGVREQVGRLAPGLDATFFVTNGHPLEITSLIERTVVQGVRVDPGEDRQHRLWQKYRARPPLSGE